MTIELILRFTHQLHSGRYGVLDKRVHIRNLNRNRDWRISQCFRAEAASLRPFPSDINRRVSDHELGVGDAIPDLETELLLGSQSTFVELNRFARVSESNSWCCSRTHSCNGFGNGRHTLLAS